MCDLDSNSLPMEEVSPLDTDEDVADDADMLIINAYEDTDYYYSYDDFLFLDIWEEHDKFLRKNSLWKCHCQNQLYFYQKYFQKAKNICDNMGVIVVWWAEQTLATMRTCIYLWAKGRH